MYQSSSHPQRDPLGAFTGVRALLDLEPEGTMSCSPEECLNYLLDTAIHRFGYSTRDVFSAVFMPATTTLLHEQAFDHRTHPGLFWPFRGDSLESPFQVRPGGEVHSQGTGRCRTYRSLSTNQLLPAHSASRDNGGMVPRTTRSSRYNGDLYWRLLDPHQHGL